MKAAGTDALILPVTDDSEALVPLMVRPEVREAFMELEATLRTNQRLYHDIELSLWHIQRGKQGPLTDALAAWIRGA